jgi:hypothetical protein
LGEIEDEDIELDAGCGMLDAAGCGTLDTGCSIPNTEH